MGLIGNQELFPWNRHECKYMEEWLLWNVVAFPTLKNVSIKNIGSSTWSTFWYVIVHSCSKIISFPYVCCFILATDTFQVINNQFTLAINVAFDIPDYVIRCWEGAALLYVILAEVAIWSGTCEKSRRLDRFYRINIGEFCFG